ncbi:hypothetical protein HDU98_001892 [Podochytrium sp. JEL0797]|nr:hypothetical protein HDU98_001892 [Podochytrium sp. JEL0797]
MAASLRLLPRRRRLRALAFTALAAIAVLLVLSRGRATRALINAEYAPQRSTLDCHGNARTCQLRNVHVKDGALALFVGKASEFDCKALGLSDAFAMFTGIGWGTGYVRFVCGDDPWLGDSLASIESGNSSSDDRKRFSIPITVYNLDPPKVYANGVTVITEPIVLYSVLWPNLFRTIYAAYAAWYSLLEYKIFFPEHHRVLLVDRSPPSPYKFMDIIQAVTPTKVMTSHQLLQSTTPIVFKTLVVGLSRDALVAEIVLERGNEWRFALRRKAFHMFCNALKQGILNGGKFVNGLNPAVSGDVLPNPLQPPLSNKKEWTSWLFHKHPKVTLVLREQNTPRQILNEDQVIQTLQSLPIRLSIHKFHDMSLLEQVRIVDKTDIFITMHGAAMTHILFLKPNAYVIELFPYAFKKVIYQNIASILGVRYLHWQNTHLSLTRFNWESVERNRVTDMPQERVTKLPIDWYNMDSKNYWRNQDTTVAVEELKHVVHTAIQDREVHGQTKYLMFMPWEQFNNQIVGFKSACAVANMLDRTLVLPHLGYKNPSPSILPLATPEFAPTTFVWHPFEHYFNLTTLAQTLPCRFTTFENFYSLHGHSTPITLRYHHLGDNKTSEQQLRDYYNHVARMQVAKLEWDSAYFQLSEREIRDLHVKDTTKVLALGSLFWYFDFGVPVKYPVRAYHDYMEKDMYRRISASLVGTERVAGPVEEAMKRVRMEEGFKKSLNKEMLMKKG